MTIAIIAPGRIVCRPVVVPGTCGSREPHLVGPRLPIQHVDGAVGEDGDPTSLRGGGDRLAAAAHLGQVHLEHLAPVEAGGDEDKDEEEQHHIDERGERVAPRRAGAAREMAEGGGARHREVARRPPRPRRDSSRGVFAVATSAVGASGVGGFA